MLDHEEILKAFFEQEGRKLKSVTIGFIGFIQRREEKRKKNEPQDFLQC